MTNALTKIYLAFTGIFIAVTGQVNANNYNDEYYSSSCCEPNCGSNLCNITFKADLLYWRPELCGLESAFGDTTIATSVNGGIITTTTTEKDEEPHSKWSPGFRIGAEAAFNCFAVEADWTHFDGRAKFRDGGQHGHWKIHYDVIDLTVGKHWCFGCFDVKPFIGLRGAIIRQSLKSHLETLFTSIIGNNTVFTDKDDKEDFWGIGPQIGFEALWNIGCDFSLYGSLAVASYYGNVKGRSYDTDTFTSTVSVCNGRQHHCFDSIATDAAIGIRWDRCVCFCNCQTNLGLRLGLEQHRIFDFSDLGSDGTLSLDGAVLGASVDMNF